MSCGYGVKKSSLKFRGNLDQCIMPKLHSQMISLADIRTLMTLVLDGATSSVVPHDLIAKFLLPHLLSLVKQKISVLSTFKFLQPHRWRHQMETNWRHVFHGPRKHRHGESLAQVYWQHETWLKYQWFIFSFLLKWGNSFFNNSFIYIYIFFLFRDLFQACSGAHAHTEWVLLTWQSFLTCWKLSQKKKTSAEIWNEASALLCCSARCLAVDVSFIDHTQIDV